LYRPLRGDADYRLDRYRRKPPLPQVLLQGLQRQFQKIAEGAALHLNVLTVTNVVSMFADNGKAA
jgi:hypothetical protein